jgi:hypothetical protein
VDVVLPWFERDASGVWTGREWASEEQARAEVGPGCTVHLETAARVGEVGFARGVYTRCVLLVPRREWRPAQFGDAH